LGSLLRRRLGREAAGTLVEPLLAGLHAGDPDRLSTLATFPELSAWEQRHGSLIRGARAAVRASRGSAGAMFASVWGGLSRLSEALVSAIGGDRIRTDAPVNTIERSGRRFAIDAGAGRLEADAVVLATPAFEAARLLRVPAPEVADGLDRIRYASTAVVFLVYPRGTGAALPSGTGFVVPSGAQANITACTWLSRKWPAPAYGDRAVVRCFVGRDGRESVLDLDDDDLIHLVRDEIESITPLRAGPAAARVVRWPRGMPQYDVGHLDRMDAIDRALRTGPGLFVAGSAYRGVGIADCIRQANDVAEEVRRHVADSVSPNRDTDRRTEQEVSR
ncbi:MAG TPA: protoporphyrinogen oxidase, partial [Actinomycetota bacterium]|nr:protoporphyrinogen oxidase [Actinomycetota bacterium]